MRLCNQSQLVVIVYTTSCWTVALMYSVLLFHARQNGLGDWTAHHTYSVEDKMARMRTMAVAVAKSRDRIEAGSDTPALLKSNLKYRS